ncbi:MAG TPA: urea transporter [Vicinamibacteria bacterium]|nr:urea transporter [Vicinamibacteria bacterium]
MTAPVLSAELGWLVIGIFSIVWIALGWFWGRHSTSFDDDVLAGRNVGLALGTATAVATWVTSNTTMAAPQLAYQLGIWGMVGYSLGAVGLMMFAPLAERIKEVMPGGYTSGDFVRVRYGRANWGIFLLISFFYGVGWLVSMGMAGGILLEALTGIPYHVGMVVIVVVCVGYTLLGGLHAVIGTDFVQSVLILLGLVVVGAVLLTTITPAEIHAALSADRPQLLTILMPASIMFLFNNLLFGLGEIFHSNVWWSRALAFRQGTGFRSYLVGGLMWLPVPVAAGGIALAVPALGVNVPALDMVGPLVVGELMGAAGALLILIIVFSSLASSLDSLLAATSDLLVEDVYRQLLRPWATELELRRMARLIVLGLGALAIVLCWGRITTLAELIQFTGAFVASTIWPIVAGLYWSTTNRFAVGLALSLGSLAGLTAYFTIGFYTAALVGASVSMVCVSVGTWIRPEPFDWSHLTAMRRAGETP